MDGPRYVDQTTMMLTGTEYCANGSFEISLIADSQAPEAICAVD